MSKVEYSIDGTVLPSDGKTVVLQHVKLGKQQLKASFVYDGTSESITHPIEIFAEKAPEVYTYTILKEYPHDRNAYTQGLEFLNDTLYGEYWTTRQISLAKSGLSYRGNTKGKPSLQTFTLEKELLF